MHALLITGSVQRCVNQLRKLAMLTAYRSNLIIYWPIKTPLAVFTASALITNLRLYDCTFDRINVDECHWILPNMQRFEANKLISLELLMFLAAGGQ